MMTDEPATTEGRPASKAGRSPGTTSTTREELLEEHAIARLKRDSAPLGSDAFKAALSELERIEVEIARIERAMDPPRG
jgi:hypothetical protein